MLETLPDLYPVVVSKPAHDLGPARDIIPVIFREVTFESIVGRSCKAKR